MQTYLDCYPCLLRHALEAARLCAAEEERLLKLVKAVLKRLAAAAPGQTPVRLTAEIHALIRAHLGVEDPYAPVKREANRLARARLPELRRRIAASPDRLDTAARIAIAGNIIDHGSLGAAYDIEATLADCLARPLDIDDLPGLRRDLTAARRLVVVGDNAGEIAFDRLLVEVLRAEQPAAEIAFIVRGSPILNDATLEDAREVGLAELARIEAAGPGAPGCELERAPAAVRALFDAADLVIAKGQGNYEALSQEPRPIYFLLKVKCPVIARDIGARPGDSVLKRAGRAEGR
jgi:hypothetical protein